MRLGVSVWCCKSRYISLDSLCIALSLLGCACGLLLCRWSFHKVLQTLIPSCYCIHLWIQEIHPSGCPAMIIRVKGHVYTCVGGFLVYGCGKPVSYVLPTESTHTHGFVYCRYHHGIATLNLWPFINSFLPHTELMPLQFSAPLPCPKTTTIMH